MKGIDVGLDLGATLAKVVLVPSGSDVEQPETLLFDAAQPETLEGFLRSNPVRLVGMTGGGARPFRDRLGPGIPSILANEFASWGAGEALAVRQAGFFPTRPHLLVSVGTGTSILLVDASGAVSRVGGTALGGGTLRGLGLLLLNEARHGVLAELARHGDSRRVDLLVGDVYPPGEIALVPDLTAANFGKVRSREPQDLAAAITRLIGENIGLLAGSIAATLGRRGGGEPARRLDVLYAGSTLRGHDVLREVLRFATDLVGAEARFLPQGEFIGALGALLLARAEKEVP